MLKNLLFFTIALAAFADAYSTIRHVPAQYPTIQAGVNAASNYDTVLVADGIYTGTGNYNIDYNNKRIVVISENGPENCLIDINFLGRGFIFNGNENYQSKLIGFSIENGEVENYGGAIYIINADPTIQNCIISGNNALGNNGDGAGIYCSNTDARITDCIISGNFAEGNGGGIVVSFNSDITLTGCEISYNNANEQGGGIYCDSSDPDITNCSIVFNYAIDDGGGMYAGDFNGSIENCTIDYNTSDNRGGGIFCASDSDPNISRTEFCLNNANNRGGGIYITYSASTVENCTIADNYSHEYGGGIYFYNAESSVLNTVIAHNMGDRGVWFYESENVELEYCNLYDNTVANFGGDSLHIPENFGILDRLNYNGDSCDVFKNIFEPPAFIDHLAGNYHLLEFSHNIDAGDPASPRDPDNTIVDIGKFYFDPAFIPPIITDLKISVSGSDILLSWTPFAAAVSYKIYRANQPYFELTGLVPLAEVNEPLYVDLGASSGACYYYRVTTVIQ